MNCPDCGANNPAGAKFCGSCGNPMQAPPSPEGGGSDNKSSWDSFFKWVGIVVVGMFVLALLSSF